MRGTPPERRYSSRFAVSEKIGPMAPATFSRCSM
jgi:hypothetical protein